MTPKPKPCPYCGNIPPVSRFQYKRQHPTYMCGCVSGVEEADGHLLPCVAIVEHTDISRYRHPSDAIREWNRWVTLNRPDPASKPL